MPEPEKKSQVARRGFLKGAGIASAAALSASSAVAQTAMSPDHSAGAPPSKPKTVGPILGAFDKIAASGNPPQKIAQDQFQFILGQIQTNALPFFQELRDDRPILRTPLVTLVSRHRDVEEIFHRELVFSVRPYLPRMMPVIGPFVLSQDITDLYEHDTAAMHLVMQRSDLARVQEIVARNAVQIVGQLAASSGAFDIVQTLTRKVPVRLAQEYIGFSAETDEQMMGWARACFREFFINILNQPELLLPAVAAGVAMKARIGALMEARRASGEKKDDVLGRLLLQQQGGNALSFDDEGVKRTLAGLVIGMIETTSQAAVQALLSLFSMPEQFAGAAAAAAADNDALLQTYVFEALRFAPINPFVERITTADYWLAASEPHGAVIPNGTKVYVLTWSAMFDERVINAPGRFQLNRPDYLYLHFGSGDHTCFGKYVSQIQVPQILKPLLKLKNLKPAGALVLDGTFPDELKLTQAS